MLKVLLQEHEPYSAAKLIKMLTFDAAGHEFETALCV